MSALPDYHKIQLPRCEPTPVRQQLPHAPADALDLIERLVVLVPTERLSAAAALEHSWVLGAGGPSAHIRAEPRMGRTHAVRSARRRVDGMRAPAGASLDVASKTSSYSPATPLTTSHADRECRIVEATVDRFGSCESKGGGTLARAWAERGCEPARGSGRAGPGV